jgi:hypothetical protein
MIHPQKPRGLNDSSSKRNQDNDEDLPDQRVILAAQEIEDKARFFWPPDFFRPRKNVKAGLLKRLSSDERFERCGVDSTREINWIKSREGSFFRLRMIHPGNETLARVEETIF